MLLFCLVSFHMRKNYSNGKVALEKSVTLLALFQATSMPLFIG